MGGVPPPPRFLRKTFHNSQHLPQPPCWGKPAAPTKSDLLSAPSVQVTGRRAGLGGREAAHAAGRTRQEPARGGRALAPSSAPAAGESVWRRDSGARGGRGWPPRCRPAVLSEGGGFTPVKSQADWAEAAVPKTQPSSGRGRQPGVLGARAPPLGSRRGAGPREAGRGRAAPGAGARGSRASSRRRGSPPPPI